MVIEVSLLFLLGAAGILTAFGLIIGYLLASSAFNSMMGTLVPSTFAAGFKLGSVGIDKTLKDLGIKSSSSFDSNPKSK